MDKKMWTKPELVILVRNRPEEAVLLSCKTVRGGAGPAAMFRTCHHSFWSGKCAACRPSQSVGVS